ncbi:MAG: thioredoxin domain-containing protein [Chitinophagaceae bacterium]
MSRLFPVFDATRDHFQGPDKAVIELVEYGDYQCERCAIAYPVIKFLQDVLRNKLRFVFRNFPLPTIHTSTLKAAIAAEAAGLQGKYWLMHDMLFENQQDIDTYSITHFARAIELDMDQFEKDLSNRKLFQKVTSDFESGIRSGVDGSPTFFINGKRYNGYADFESLYKTCSMVIPYEEHSRSYVSQSLVGVV